MIRWVDKYKVECEYCGSIFDIWSENVEWGLNNAGVWVECPNCGHLNIEKPKKKSNIKMAVETVGSEKKRIRITLYKDVDVVSIERIAIYEDDIFYVEERDGEPFIPLWILKATINRVMREVNKDG